MANCMTWEGRSMDRKALFSTTLAGAIAELAMVVAGHFIPVIKDLGFAVAGMVISLIVGAWFARVARAGWGPSLVGGAIAGGVGALIGILVSAAIGDTPWLVATYGTASSTVAGILGAALVRGVRRRTA